MSQGAETVRTAREATVEARMRLAYEAAVNELTREDQTLGNLRNRSNGVLTIAALITSFAAGVGFMQTDPGKGALFPQWAAISLLAILAVIVAIHVVVIWPIDFNFGPNARAFLRPIENPDDGPIERRMIEELIYCAKTNTRKINVRTHFYQAAVFLLGAEVIVILAASLSA